MTPAMCERAGAVVHADVKALPVEIPRLAFHDAQLDRHDTPDPSAPFSAGEQRLRDDAAVVQKKARPG